MGFSWRTDEAARPERVLTWVTHLGAGPIPWTAASTEPWLLVDPAAGITPEPLEIVPDHGQLGPGVHTAQVIVTSPGALNSPWAIDVTVEVRGPEEPETRFRRGDASGDGKLDLTDAVRILSYLFTGGAAPACLDAADVDDSAVIDLSDAVGALDLLFLGGRPPRPPAHLDCGEDPTEDALTCETQPVCGG